MANTRTDAKTNGLLELSLDAVIGFAMRSEHAARTFYERAAQRAQEHETRALFLRLAEQELQHFQSLAAACRKRFPGGFAGAMELSIEGRDEHLAPGPLDRVLPDISLLEVVTIAIWEEVQARDTYRRAARDSDDGPAELKTLLKALAEEEQLHLNSLVELRRLLLQDSA